MSRRKEIDIEEFKRLYASGLSYTKIAQKLNCSVSVVNNYRITLKLPPRERVYECKEIDEALFRKLSYRVPLIERSAMSLALPQIVY